MVSNLSDYESWVSDRAETLAQQQFNCGFSEIQDNHIQYRVWTQAEQDWHEIMAEKADRSR